jgi:hypothetical protein
MQVVMLVRSQAKPGLSPAEISWPKGLWTAEKAALRKTTNKAPRKYNQGRIRELLNFSLSDGGRGIYSPK